MAVTKTERLVNLTMALLAAQRFMPKGEIFRKVAGYDSPEATQEAKERMFERDKDDLRSLGIEIEVASQDPLFEDEPGYRIRSDRYRMPPKSFTGSELATIATALSIYSSDELGRHSKNLMQRIRILQEVTPDSEIELSSTFALDESILLEVAAALAVRQTINFSYRKPGQSESQQRTVNPMGLCAWRDSWYLVGEDLEVNEIRVFKLERFTREISRRGAAGSYEIPSDFAVRDYVVMLQGRQDLAIVADLKVRRGRGLRLRGIAQSLLNLDEDWDQIRVSFESEADALAQVLWYGSDIELIAPTALRTKIIDALAALVAHHG